MMDAKTVIQRLTEQAEDCLKTAQELRTIFPQLSWDFFQIHETMENAISILKEKKTATREREGGGSTWWHVCSECHGPVDTNDIYCRHCGSRLS